MFTGIIEAKGSVVEVQPGENGILRYTFSSPISHELKIDQSLSHDGVCLTVVWQEQDRHAVDVIPETIARSRFGKMNVGDEVNLERAMQANGRLDGHLVQGHVDSIGTCTEITDGYYMFAYPQEYQSLVVEKGSICINGVSLTVARVPEDAVGVALIPYTLEQTNFGTMRTGDTVNLEFDILGKYVQKHLEHYSLGSRPERIVL